MGSKTTTQTTENVIPSYMTAAGQHLIGSVLQQQMTPRSTYADYGGVGVADLDPNEQRAIDNVNAQQGNWKGGMDEGDSLIRLAMGGYGTIGDVAGFEGAQADYAKDIKTNKWDGAAADRYMSPYVERVLDAKTKRLGKERERAMAASNLRKAMTGNFGGGRHGVADAEMERNFADQIEESNAKGYNDAWNQAQSMFTSDEGRALDADKSNQDSYIRVALANQASKNQGLASQFDARKYNQDTKLKQFNTERDREMTGGQGLIDSTIQRKNLENLDNENLMGTGQLRRGIDQAKKDFDYGEFLRNEDKFYKDSNLLTSALGGTPYSSTSTTTSTAPKGGLFGKILGTGVAIGSQFLKS